MKKVTVVLFAVFLLGANGVVAASNKVDTNITNERTVGVADKDTTLTYGKLKFLIPAGQAISLGETANGSILLRADEMQGVKVGTATLRSKGPVVLFVEPKTNAIIVDQGEKIQVVDSNGRTAELSQGAAVSGNDIRESVERAWLVNLPLSWQVQHTTAQPKKPAPKTVEVQGTTEIPDFVDEAALFEAIAHEQATRDVEDTLSPSAPR